MPAGKKMGQRLERLRKPLDQDGMTQSQGVERKGGQKCPRLAGSAGKIKHSHWGVLKSKSAILRSLELPRDEPSVAFL